MRLSRLTLVSLAPLLLVPVPGASTQEPPDARDFVRDVGEIVRLVETHHPAPFCEVSRDAWLGEADAIEEAALEGEAPERLAVRMMAWVARLGDGHTNLEPAGVEAFARWYPVRFHEFADGLYITGAARDGLPVNGARVLRLGDVPAEEAATRQAGLQGADNAFGAREERDLLSNAGVMEALGLASPGEPLRILVASDGDTRRVRLDAVRAPFSFGWRFWGEMFGPPLGEERRSRREWRARRE